MKTMKVVFCLTVLSFLMTGQALADGTSITSQGVQFPDGTLQTTKAVETGTPGPQGPSLGVYSNDGQYLGVVIDSGLTSVQLFIPSIGMFCGLTLLKDTSEYCDITMHSQYFETTDCTGTSYIDLSVPFSSPWLGTISSQIYKNPDGSYVATGNVKVVTVKSYMSNSTMSTSSCVEKDESIHAIELITAPSLPFTTPIRLPLKYEYK